MTDWRAVERLARNASEIDQLKLENLELLDALEKLTRWHNPLHPPDCNGNTTTGGALGDCEAFEVLAKYNRFRATERPVKGYVKGYWPEHDPERRAAKNATSDGITVVPIETTGRLPWLTDNDLTGISELLKQSALAHGMALVEVDQKLRFMALSALPHLVAEITERRKPCNCVTRIRYLGLEPQPAYCAKCGHPLPLPEEHDAQKSL